MGSGNPFVVVPSVLFSQLVIVGMQPGGLPLVTGQALGADGFTSTNPANGKDPFAVCPKAVPMFPKS